MQAAFHRLIPRFCAPRRFANLHHSILKGAHWEIRDSRIAAPLENKRGEGKEVAATSGGSVAGVFQEPAGSSICYAGAAGQSRSLRQRSAARFPPVVSEALTLTAFNTATPRPPVFPHGLRDAFHETVLE
jgi:hypothetical protein